MKKFKLILPIGIVAFLSGCCCPQDTKQIAPQQTIKCCVPAQQSDDACLNKNLKKVNQKEKVNINVKIKEQEYKKGCCELSEDAPITPYIDYY